jgi:hypothetical protein
VTGQQCRWTPPKLPVTCRPTTPAPTKTVTEADALKNYLACSGLASIRELSWSQNDPPDAKLGDIIGYDWNGGADGVIDHVMMITNFSGGYPWSRATPSPRSTAVGRGATNSAAGSAKFPIPQRK